MARAAVLGRLTWQLAELTQRVQQTPRVTSLHFNVPDWRGHLPGQHVDVRLTAEDGYQTERSYSIASPPEAHRLELTIERLDNGEVSPYLVDDLQVGDRLELRGPIGGYFVWRATETRPLLLVGGGSGVVPLMAMLRHRSSASAKTPARLLYSSRSLEDVIFRDELERLAAANDGLEVHHTLTRSQPPGWKGYARRIDAAVLADVAWPTEEMPEVFVCGPTPFVESVAKLMVGVGMDYKPEWIKTERFGATGGP